MSDDYLWDRSGPPDPEVEALERLLARFRSAPERRPSGMPGRPWWQVALAAAAVALLAVGAAWLGPSPAGRPAVESGVWRLSALAGTPRVGTEGVLDERQVPVGTWIETDAAASAQLEIGDAGQAIISPNSRLRITRHAPGDHRMHLEHGTLTALVWAPPGQVVVSTPAATAVDLGCAYTLTIDEHGRGRLHVTAGWVGLVHDGREAFIPAGAAVGIYGETGPGTPVLTDASERVAAAVQSFDTADDAGRRRQALDTLLQEASDADALTLWHLIDRVEPTDRLRVFDALAAKSAPPSNVTREGIAAGQRAMIDAWWSSLGYGDVDWWRLWQRQWRADANRAP